MHREISYSANRSSPKDLANSVPPLTGHSSSRHFLSSLFFAGICGAGGFPSTNNCTSWASVNSGLPDTGVLALAVSGGNDFAGTQASGVWRRPLSEMITSVSGSSAILPMEFRLAQNYPNPFNPSTTIRYELPKGSIVRLSVYDILGREVTLLVNEGKNAGVYELKFDAQRMSSGVYFC